MNNFFASIYELGGLLTIGHNGEFSYALWQNELYAFAGAISWLSILSSLLLFYFAIDHPRFNRWYHWLLVSGLIAILNGITAFIITRNTFIYNQLYDFGIEYIEFAILNLTFTFFFFIVFTSLFRLIKLTNLSTNCSTCPIPN